MVFNVGVGDGVCLMNGVSLSEGVGVCPVDCVSVSDSVGVGKKGW